MQVKARVAWRGQGGSRGNEEKGPDVGYILKIKQREFSHEWDVGMGERKESRMTQHCDLSDWKFGIKTQSFFT